MKKILIVIVILSLAAGAGILIGNFFNKDKGAKSSIKYSLSKIGTKNSDNKFIWGAQGGAYVLNRLDDGYRQENVAKQLKAIDELGINLVRANLEVNRVDSPFQITPHETTNDDYISKLAAKNLDILLVLDPDIPQTIDKANYEQEGYKLASYAAKRYRDKVNYYQIANEVSGTIVKPADYQGAVFKGENEIQYSVERYKATLGWVKGMARGIRENDPEAKIVLCGHWILYDIFQKLIDEGVDFDIIGWSWYSPDGLDVTKREYNYGNYLNLAEKLAQYKKELWIVETNSDHGSYFDGKLAPAEGEKQQADFIEKFAENAYNSGYFKGFIVFTLFDNPVSEEIGNPQDAHWGLVEVKKIGGENKIIKYKEAFHAYKDFISNHKTLPKALQAR